MAVDGAIYALEFEGKRPCPIQVRSSSAAIAPRACTFEYDVETYGARKKVELPFVMGVMSDLSGKSQVEKKDLKDRDFLEFDMDNFDKRMAAIAPRAAFNVDNEIEGEGKLAVDLTFKKMEDFDPGEIAKAVPALAKLLEAREQLNDLLVLHGRQGERAGIARQGAEGPGPDEGAERRQGRWAGRARRGRGRRGIISANMFF